MRQVPPSAPGTIGANPPGDSLRAAVVRSAEARRPAAEPSGTSMKAARPIVRGQEFYKGTLAPGARMFGKLELGKGEALRFRVYMQKAFPVEGYQALRLEVADGYGGVVAKEIESTRRAAGDMFDVWECGYEAKSDGLHYFGFYVAEGKVAMNLRILVEG